MRFLCVTDAFDPLDFFVVNSIVWKSVAVSPAFCAPSFTVWEGEWGTCVFWRENYHNMTLPPPPFPLLPGRGEFPQSAHAHFPCIPLYKKILTGGNYEGKEGEGCPTPCAVLNEEKKKKGYHENSLLVKRRPREKEKKVGSGEGSTMTTTKGKFPKKKIR